MTADTAFKEALAALQDAQRKLGQTPKADVEAREAARLAVADASARVREAKDAKKRADELRNFAGLTSPLAIVIAQRFPPDVVAELHQAAVEIVVQRQAASAAKRAAKAAAPPPPPPTPPPPPRSGPEVFVRRAAPRP